MSAEPTIHTYPLLWLAPVLLGGCPFVFGPPDTSNVDIDIDIDTGTTSETGTDTGPTETGPFDVPNVVLVSGRRFHDVVRFEIEMSDDDLDLVGGTLELSSSVGDAVSLTIPNDIGVWRDGDISLVDVPVAFLDCIGGYDATWTVHAVDAAGHAGPDQGINIEVKPLGLFEEDYYAHFAGVINEPSVACVTFEGDILSGYFEQQLYNDLEGIEFRVPEDGDYTISIAWESSMDVDLFIYNTTNFPGALIASSVSYGSTWEAITLPLLQGVSYQAAPSFWALYGAAAPYRVTVLFRAK